MSRQYRQSIQIGKNVGDILNLPCVNAVRKSEAKRLVYEIATAYDPKKYATAGDWICEDYSGDWHVVSSLQMEELLRMQAGII